MRDAAYRRESDAASRPAGTARPSGKRWPPGLSILLAVLVSLGFWALLFFILRALIRAL